LTKNKIKKVLVIRFSSIGDIVLTTPVVRCVKKQLSAEVHYLTKNSFQKVISSNPYLDKIYSIDKKVSEVLSQLKAENYDCIIDLHKNLRSKQVKWALRVPYFTFDKINWEKWLMVNLKINKLPEIHIVDRYMAAVKPLGVSYDGEGLEPPPTPKGASQNQTEYRTRNKEQGISKESRISGTSKFEIPCSLFNILKEFNPLGSLGARGYICFAIGGAHATKRLPISKIIAICKQINLPVILIGGPDDATIGEKVVLEVKKDTIINACGKTSLEESAMIIEYARKVITHDTGMMHIAAAYQKPIISIWGNTIPEFGMYPFYKKGVNNNVSIEVKDLSCRPCSKIGYAQCPKGHFKCMMDIDIKEIIDLTNEED